jgi:hypothetical protein
MMVVRLFLLILFIPILVIVLRRIGRNFQVRPSFPSEILKTVRDPVCQTFLDPSSPLVLSEPDESSGRVYFCSAQCQSKYHLLHEKPS